MKNEQRAKLAKRAELPRVKLEYASNCRAPIWHRVEMGRAQLDRVTQARVKKDAPKWTDSAMLYGLETDEKTGGGDGGGIVEDVTILMGS